MSAGDFSAERRDGVAPGSDALTAAKNALRDVVRQEAVAAGREGSVGTGGQVEALRDASWSLAVGTLQALVGIGEMLAAQQDRGVREAQTAHRRRLDDRDLCVGVGNEALRLIRALHQCSKREVDLWLEHWPYSEQEKRAAELSLGINRTDRRDAQP